MRRTTADQTPGHVSCCANLDGGAGCKHPVPGAGHAFLEEEDNSEKFCRAPLILIPVELGRSDARDRFHLKYTGEELGENVSLAEKLKQSFGIRNFPELPDPDDLDVVDLL